MPTPGDNAFTDEELLALLRDASVAVEAITNEMADAGAPPLLPVELVTTRAALQAVETVDPAVVAGLPPRLRAFVLDEALSRKAGALIGALAGSADKTVAKEAKRLIHLLKTQGVKVEAAKAPSGAAPSGAPPPEDYPTFMSSVDGFGERILLVPRPARTGVDVAQVVVSDVHGVVEARLAPLARKEFRRFVVNLSTAGGVLVGEVPRSYARGLISAALDLNARARRPVPAGYNEVAFALGPANPPQPSPGRALPLPEELAGWASRAAELMASDAMRTWMPAEDALRPLALRIDEIGVSPLYLDDAQREAGVRQVMDDAVHAYWTAARRQLVAERLFDVAWLLHGAGRADEANIALASARWLGSDRPVEGVTFCYALFEKLLPILRNQRASPPGERTSPAGLILPG